jgi:hypothetical protein
MAEVTPSSWASTRVEEWDLFQKGGIVVEFRTLFMRREITILSTRKKENRGSDISRPTQIVSRVSSERRKMRTITMTRVS